MTQLDQLLPAVPPGRWAVGVSGGADSVALLLLLCRRPDLSLHVCHLNHQTRGSASDADAAFVADLAARLHLPCTIVSLDEVEKAMQSVETNPSARYRAARLALFGRVVRDQSLQGVLLAHHANDQAETVLQRLLRGVGLTALAGMAVDEQLGGLRVVRPVLGVSRDTLRAVLAGEPWREDASNASPAYLRNRLRIVLYDPGLSAALLQLAAACRGCRSWAEQNAPVLPDRFPMQTLAASPLPLAHAAARRWLRDRGVPPDRIDSATCDRLIALASDRATSHRQMFPGKLAVRRRDGSVFAESATDRL